METTNRKIILPFGASQRLGEALGVSQPTIRKALKFEEKSSWRSMTQNGTTYYDYATIPSRTRCLLTTEEALLNTSRNIKTKSNIAECLIANLGAKSVEALGNEKFYEIFSWFMYGSGVKFDSDKARLLTEGYAVAMYVKELRKKGSFQRWGFDKLSDFDSTFIEFLKQKCYPNFKPSSIRALRTKLEAINIPANMITGN